jgi:hypothetical protein
VAQCIYLIVLQLDKKDIASVWLLVLSHIVKNKGTNTYSLSHIVKKNGANTYRNKEEILHVTITLI